MSRHGQVMPLVLVSQDLARYSKIRPKYCKSYQDMVKLPCHVMTRYSKICPNMPGYVKNSQGMPCYTNVRLDIANQWPDMGRYGQVLPWHLPTINLWTWKRAGGVCTTKSEIVNNTGSREVRQPLMKDTLDERQPLMEDDLWQKTTFDERRP